MTEITNDYPIIEERISSGDDFFENLTVRESVLSPNKLYFRDDLRKTWLYQANCLARSMSL